MDNEQVHICPKCNGEMLKSYDEGKFSNEPILYCAYSGTSTVEYMCKHCGYIEKYAKNPDFYKK